MWLLSTTVMNRRDAVYGLKLFSPIAASYLLAANLSQTVPVLQVLRVLNHLFTFGELDVRFLPIPPVAFVLAAAAHLAYKFRGAHRGYLHLENLLHGFFDLGLGGFRRNFKDHRVLRLLHAEAFFRNDRPPDNLIMRGCHRLVLPLLFSPPLARAQSSLRPAPRWASSPDRACGSTAPPHPSRAPPGHVSARRTAAKRWASPASRHQYCGSRVPGCGSRRAPPATPTSYDSACQALRRATASCASRASRHPRPSASAPQALPKAPSAMRPEASSLAVRNCNRAALVRGPCRHDAKAANGSSRRARVPYPSASRACGPRRSLRSFP